MNETKERRTGWLAGIFGRKQLAATGRPPTAEEIKDWLVGRISETLEVPASEIDPQEEFANFGLDSRTSIALAGDLAAWLGREVPPTTVWEFPTIAAVAEHLAATPDPRHSPTTAVAAEDADATVAQFMEDAR